MCQIKDWIMWRENYEKTNCFLLTIVCAEMDQGWLMDKYKKRVYTLEHLVSGLCDVATLKGKPKVVIIQQYTEGRALFI